MWGRGWDWEGVGSKLLCCSGMPSASIVRCAGGKTVNAAIIVVRGRMNRSLLFYIGLGRLFNRSPFILVLRSIPFACRVLSSDAQQHSATAQA